MRPTDICRLLVFVLILVLSMSCSGNREHPDALLPELQQAERIMYDAPDSALQILQSMAMPLPEERLQHATWALFMTQARYKLYIDQSDSLLNIAYDYFMRQRDAQRKAMVLYYKAALYKEEKEIEKSQEYYLKAIDEAEKTRDYLLNHLIYSELSDLYAYRHLTDYALQACQKSYEYALKGGNQLQILSAYVGFGRIYSLSEYKKSIEYYKKALEIAEAQQKHVMASGILTETATCYMEIKDYDNALKCMQRSFAISRTNGIDITEQKYHTIGDLYRRMGKQDSAYYYLNKSLTHTNIYTTAGTYACLYYLARDEKEYEKAAFYCEKALLCQDSIFRLDKSKSLAELQEKYDQQKLVNEKNQIKIERDRLLRYALIGVIILICIIALLIHAYQRKLLIKERKIQEEEEKLHANILQMQENEMIINDNQRRIDELTQQLNASEGMQEQMEEQTRVLEQIRNHNEALERENQTLQQSIEHYSTILREKSEERERLQKLVSENRLLHDREKFLTNQLVFKDETLNRLKKNPKYMDSYEWSKVQESINYLFDNYTVRLSKMIPTLTDSDLQICCLIKLRIPNPDIATILSISPTSVTKRKQRLKERILSVTGSFGESQILDLWLWDF